MTDHEFEITQEEKAIARLQGVVIGATGCAIFIGLIHLIIYLES